MNEVQFAQEMTQRGCVGDGTQYCGTFNGYPFVAIFLNGRQGKGTSFTIRITLGGNVNGKKLFKAVKQKTKGILTPYLNYNQNVNIAGTVPLQTTCKNDSEFGGVFDALLNAMVASAAELGNGVPDICPVCKQGGCDAYAYQEGSYRPVHDQCVRGKAVEVQAKHDKNQRQGSYALGAVGALIGSAVGAIPTILLMVFANIISGWACALIPICGYFGYRLIGGKRTKLATIIVIICAILVVPVMDYLTWYLPLSMNNGIYITPQDYIGWVMELDADIMYYLVMELFFTLVGIAIAWGIIKKDGSGEVQDASFSVDTLRPMNTVAGVPGMGAAAIPDASTAPAPTMQSAVAAQAEQDLEA